MWYLVCILIGFCIAACIYYKREEDFEVGDIVYLKPTNLKCIITDTCGRSHYFLSDMDGKVMRHGFSYHRGMLIKVKDE